MANRTALVVHAQDERPFGRPRSRWSIAQERRKRCYVADGLAPSWFTGKLRVEIGPVGVVVRDQYGRVTWSSPRGPMQPATE